MSTLFYLDLPLSAGGSGGVSSLNTLTGALSLVGGTGITITPSGSNITITATGGGSGVTTLAAVGSTPNANAGSISGVTLTLQPGDGTHPGVLTANAQTFGGVKTFSSAPILSSLTASQALVLDASNNVTSLVYTSFPSVSSIVSRDASANTQVNGLLATTAVVAGALVPNAATVPVNGMYLSATNNVAIATNTTNRLTIGTAASTFTTTLAASNLSGTNTGDVTLGTANGLSLSGQALSLGTASTSTTGALTSTDWNTFNGKVSGPGTSTNLTIPTFNGTTGKILLNNSGVAINSNVINATGFTSQPASGTNNEVFGSGASIVITGSFPTTDAVAIGNTALVGANSPGAVAIGSGATVNASSNLSIAIGNTAVAGGLNSFALGYNANASGDHSIAFGGNTIATGGDTIIGYASGGSGGDIVIGERSAGSGSDVIIGSTAFGANTGNVSIGEGNSANGADTLIGAGNTGAGNDILIGPDNLGAGNSIVIGVGQGATSPGQAIWGGAGFRSLFNTSTDDGVNTVQIDGSSLASVYAVKYQRITPSTGFSQAITNGLGALIIHPSGTLATGTITMPTTPVDGQILSITSSQTITVLTISPAAGQTIIGAPTTIATTSQVQFIYVATDTSWYRA